jgi:hypothetical protein
MDEAMRRRLKTASLEELKRARENGELTEDDYDEILEERRRARAYRTGFLIAAGLFGLGILIVCGGCGLVLMKPWH